MNELGKGFDGTVEKAISSTEKLKNLPKILQKYMMWGDYKSGLITKIDGSSFENDENGKNIQNYVAQIANLDKAQQDAVISVTKLNKGADSFIQTLIKATQTGSRINGKLFESTLKSWSHGDILAGDINSLMAVGNMKNGDKYALPDTKQAIKNINDWANAVENAEAKQRLLNSGILETDGSTVKLSSGFLKLIQVEKTDAAVTAGLTAEKKILNIVMQAGKQLLVSIAIGAFIKGLEVVYKKMTQIDDKIAEVANDSKQQADNLSSTSKSLKDLVSQYEKMGDKTYRTAEESEKLAALQEQITTLLKDQPGVSEEMLKQVNLQNASYDTQLQLLKDIEEQQRKNAHRDLVDNVEDQGDLLVEAYKKKAQRFKVGANAGERNIVKELIRDGFGNFEDDTGDFNFNIDPEDPDAILDLYDSLGEEVDKLTETYSDDELEGLKNVRKELKQYIEDYKNGKEQLHDNELPDVTNDALKKLQNQKELADSFTPSKPAEEVNFDDSIKKTKEYQAVLKNLQDTKEKFEEKGFNQYGNINNLNRDMIYWTDENKKKYHDFAEEHPDDVAGEYSTVLGTYDNIYNGDKSMPLMVYTPMLQTDDGLVPLTNEQVQRYIETIAESSWTEDNTLDLDKLLKLDAEGLEQDINGEIVRVKGLIGGIEGTKGPDGNILTKADIMAMSGNNNQEIISDMQRMYNLNRADLPNASDNLSQYVGNSMHDIQGAVSEAEKDVDRVYKLLDTSAKKSYENTAKYCDEAAQKQFSDYTEIKNAVDTLKAGVSGFDTTNLTSLLNSDGENLGRIDTEALEKLKQIMTDFGFDPTVAADVQAFVDTLKQLEIVSPSVIEKNQQIAQSVTDAATQMSNASQGIDDMQKAYQACKSAVDEYNKTKYVSADTLQTLMNLNPQYLSMLQDEDGQLSINTLTAKKLTAATIQTQRAALLANAVTQIQQTNTLAAAQKVLGEAQATIGNATQILTSALYQSAEEGLENNGSFEEMQAVLAAGHQIISNYKMMDKLWAELAKQNPDKIWGKNSTSKSNKTAKASKTALDAWSSLSSAMKEFNQQGYITLQTLKSLSDLEDRYVALLTKNDVTGQLEIQTDAFYNLTKAELKAAQAKGDGVSELEYNKILEWTNRNIKKQTMSYWDLIAAIEGYSAALSGAKDITDTFKDAWSNGKTVKEKQKKSRAGALDYEGTEAQSSALQDLMKYSEYDPELIGKAFNKETGKIDLSGDMLKTAVAESLKQQAAAARTEGGAAAEAIAASYEKSAENIENDVISVQDYFDGLGSTIEEVSSKIDEVQSAWSDLGDVTNEYNTYGGLSVDSIQKLLTMSPEYLQFLKMDGDQLVFNRDAMLAYAKANLLTKAAELELKDETKDQAEILRALANSLDKGADSMDGMGSSAEKLKSGLSDLKDVFSSLLSLFEKFNTDKDNDLKLWGDAMGKVIDKRIEALNKQKEALEENNEATERAIELSKAQDALARAQQQRTTRVYTENGYEWQANAEDVRTAREDLADKQREWNNKDAEKAIDDQIKKYNEFKDKLSEVMDDIGKSWKDYQKELEYTAQIQKMSLSQMEGSLDGYHNKIIASLNTGSAITGIQNLITNLESLINTLTKLNNLYSMFKTGEYKDLGTKGLWNTIKGFLNNGGEKAASSGTSYVNAAKQAVNAVKTTLVDTATETGTALKNILTTANNNITKQVVSSGNGIINAFTNIWNTIKGGAQSLFGGSGEGGGIVSTVVNGFKAVGNAVSKSKIGSTILGGIGKVGTTLLSGGGKLLAGAGKLIGTAGSALAAAGPAAIPILAAGGLGIYGGTKAMKNQKKIWSNKEDGFGKKAIKSVASFFWDISPIGGIVNLCKDIFGKSKETAENTKDTANSSSETAENTQKSATNLTINATQIVSKEENKATDETDKKNDATANEDKTVKTAATTLTGAGLGAAAGMAVGGPVGALIGTLLGGFAGFFLGGHANGLKSSKTNHFANVDERGSELIVRKPASGRYTYLETGDGVVPADITSRLFEMGGNPDKWFSDQLAKHSSASMVQSRDAGGISLSIGDVNVNNPVGDSDALARELVNRLPNKVVQELNRR
jgi:hypothetical protein